MEKWGEKSEKGKKQKRIRPKFGFSPVRSNEPRFAPLLDPDSSPKKGKLGIIVVILLVIIFGEKR